MATALEGIERKLVRADDQLEFLRDQIGAFLNSEPKAFSTQGHEEPPSKDAPWGEVVWVVKVHRSPPAMWSLVVSEMIHHWHTALDQLAWGVAERHRDRTPPRETGFPVFKSAEAYRALWTRSSGYCATRSMPPHAQAIIEDVQPYHRRHNPEIHPLWVLRRLANIDKHQAPHLMGSALVESGHSHKIPFGEVASMPRPKFFIGPFEDGAVLARWPFPPEAGKDAAVQMKVDFGFHIGFPKEGPAKGRNADRVLVELRHQVALIFERLRPFL